MDDEASEAKPGRRGVEGRNSTTTAARRFLKMRLAVLGVSNSVGRLVARSLSEHPFVESVVQADLGGISRALAECDAALGCWESDIQADKVAALAAISSRIPYISSSESAEAFQSLSELDDKAASAGTLVVAGMSWAPGMSNLMAMLASEQLDKTERVSVAWATSSAGPSGPGVLSRLLERLSNNAVVFDEGEWRLEKAGTQQEQVFFPLPVGWCSVRLAASAEPLCLPHSLPGVQQVWAKAGVVEKRVDRMISGMGGTTARRAGKLAAATTATRMLSAVGSLNARGQSWSALRVDVAGMENSARSTVTYGVLDQLPNLLSAPVVAAGLLVGGGRAKGKGVVPPEQAFEPAEFFGLLAERGVRLARLEV